MMDPTYALAGALTGFVEGVTGAVRRCPQILSACVLVAVGAKVLL